MVRMTVTPFEEGTPIPTSSTVSIRIGWDDVVRLAKFWAEKYDLVEPETDQVDYCHDLAGRHLGAYLQKRVDDLDPSKNGSEIE